MIFGCTRAYRFVHSEAHIPHFFLNKSSLILQLQKAKQEIKLKHGN